ncbi:WG repeat-containing protein [Aquimarina sp. 2-A2]
MSKLFITFVLIPFLGMAQTIENIDYISPFHNEVAAIKKGSQWAFINNEGKIVVDF